MKKTTVIIGAGAAGLSAAYHILTETNDTIPIIIEELDVVGGLARTINGTKNGFDLGPRRFFTKNDDVLNLWKTILPFQSAPAIDDKILNRQIKFESNNENANPEKFDKVFLKRKRFSRIYYKKHFIDYPIKLKPVTMLAMGIPKTFIAGMSYLKSCVHKVPETNLETFMINRFGRVLYELFFEGYTEKVWGIHPSKISKEWGMQRIKGISLISVVKNAILEIFTPNSKKEISLIDEYYYPKLGSSQFYETLAEEIIKRGGEIHLNSKVTGINKEGNKIKSINITDIKTKEKKVIEGDLFVSSMPVKELLTEMNDVPSDIYAIAKDLQYRDFILVNYVTNGIKLKNNTKLPTINNIAPDSWIYLQDNGIAAGRLDIMNNFSPYIIKNFKEDVVINLEYFCNETDKIWQDTDENIINLGIEELKKLDVTTPSNIKESSVHRIKKAYPSYFGSYDKFDKIKEYINSLDNLYCIGRNGQHKYNNMDHSILSGIVAARVIKNNLDKNILWDVNTDTDYQEIKK